jgi:hypothetical protein
MKEVLYVSHMVVLELHYSLNLLIFFESIFPILTFDIVPSDDIYEWMFKLSEVEDEPKSENFDQIGYGATLVYNNLGSLLMYQVCLWLFLIINSFILKFVLTEKTKYKKSRKFLL